MGSGEWDQQRGKMGIFHLRRSYNRIDCVHFIKIRGITSSQKLVFPLKENSNMCDMCPGLAKTESPKELSPNLYYFIIPILNLGMVPLWKWDQTIGIQEISFK